MATLIRQASLSDILIRRGALPAHHVERLLAEALGSQLQLYRLLLERQLLPDDQLARAVAEQYGLPFHSLQDHRIVFEDFPSLPLDLMREFGFVPLADHDGLLTLATADPHDVGKWDRFERQLGQSVRFVVAPPRAIVAVLADSARSSQMVTRVTEEFRPLVIPDDDTDPVLSLEKINADQSPIVRLVNTIILNALQKRASDIHIEAGDATTQVKYRIDGVLYLAMEPLDTRFHNPAVSRLKVMAELDIAERRIPQDGRFKLRIDSRTIDFRVSILPSVNGESVVIRILAKEEFTNSQKGLHLEALGFRTEDVQRFRRASLASYGMVLVTGPTGSGKTTTLYAAINEVNTQEDKIITIEDPVEYQLKGVVQIPVNEKKGLTFARGLRSILRHDPDKIMVGEIRDAETAQIAIQSALTGHLVFTTVHANNAFDVIGRFVNMGIEPYNFVSALNCIMAQRLVRRICQHCKAPVTVTEAQCRDLGFEFATFAGRATFEGTGCVECQGLGYRGRLAITEFLLLTDPIKELILDHRPMSEIKRAASVDGMTSLREAGVNRILSGDTTMREVNRMTFTG